MLVAKLSNLFCATLLSGVLGKLFRIAKSALEVIFLCSDGVLLVLCLFSSLGLLCEKVGRDSSSEESYGLGLFVCLSSSVFSSFWISLIEFCSLLNPLIVFCGSCWLKLGLVTLLFAVSRLR